MKDKIIIDKESIKEFDEVKIYLGRSRYDFDIGAVADVNFEVTPVKRSADLKATDGFIELAPEALDAPGEFVDETGLLDMEYITEPILSGLEKGTDISKVCFTSREKELTVYLPCDPLTDCIGRVVESSNCPSFEILPDGTLRICVGKSSKSPQREKLICSDVCENWDFIMDKKYCPDILKVGANYLKIKEDGIAIGFEVYNRDSPVSDVEFFFKDCKIHSFYMCLGQGKLNTDIEIARMVNGHIYVRLHGCRICLECKEVSVYYAI
ncbi:MAG: hypothetical protein K2K38_05145 [Clostridia bacterium]|nr:hypothetical protein [Clostridia bacterium]